MMNGLKRCLQRKSRVFMVKSVSDKTDLEIV